MNLNQQLTAAFSLPLEPVVNPIPDNVRDWRGHLVALEFRGRYPADKVFMKNGSPEALHLSAYFSSLDDLK